MTILELLYRSANVSDRDGCYTSLGGNREETQIRGGMNKKKGIKGYRPKKRLGQYFLKDRRVVRNIIQGARFRKSDHALEIGPGLGALTVPMAGYVRKITAVEKDSQLADMLKERLSVSGVNNVNLINEDILRFDLEGVRGKDEDKLVVIGNVPYSISSPLLERIMACRNLISRAILMFQYEFAGRLLAGPGGKEYGALTVLIRYNAAVSSLVNVPREAFYPKPEVGSAVVNIDLERPYPVRTQDEAHLKRVVRGAFTHRRKTVFNSLRSALPPYGDDVIYRALERAGIDTRRRAETIDIDEYVRLASELLAISC
jgi:16S rRNA (adenine1518-N6/adenine1519-N6)-dimethyltransferase